MSGLERLSKRRDPVVGSEVGCVHFDWEDGAQMARLLVSDELWELIEPLIPKVPRRQRFPGRKRIDDRRVLTGILFVLQTGIPWEYLPAGDGLRLRRHLLAPAQGVAGSRGLAAAARAAVGEAQRGR